MDYSKLGEGQDDGRGQVMDATGRINDIHRDWKTDKLVVSFLLDNVPSDIEAIQGCDLDITARKHRRKRSLNANSYFHVLVTEIAGAVGDTNTSIKNRLIREYGAFEYINGLIPTFLLKAEYEADMMVREDIHVKVIAREHKDGEDWVRCAFMRGSHTYNTAEMSRLIDGTVEEAKGLGIETLTPDKINHMKMLWGTSNEVSNTG